MGDSIVERWQRSLPDVPDRSIDSPPLPTSNPRRARRSTHVKRDSSVRELERAVKQWQWEADELRQLLDTSADQLQAEKQHSKQLEELLRDAEARSIAHEVARQKAEMEIDKLKEESKRYKLQLEMALREIKAAQVNIDNADMERNKAEEAAARARDRERQLMQTIAMRDARDAGIREGKKEGYKEGLARGRAEAKMEEREQFYKAFDDFLRRTWPDGIPENMETPALRWRSGGKASSSRQGDYVTPPDRRRQSPEQAYRSAERARSPARSAAPPPPPKPINMNVAMSPVTAPQPQQPQFFPGGQDFPRSRRASFSSPGPQLPPPPSVPDVAPLVAPTPMNAMTTPMQLPQPMMTGTGAPSIASRRSRPVTPANDAATFLSQPIPVSPAHSRPHTPILDIPDGYVPVIRENEQISLPPPHEVQPTRGTLPQTQDEANKMGEVSYDFTRSRAGSRARSRAPSRASMRTAGGGQPQGEAFATGLQMALDPAQIFTSQPSRPASRAGGAAPTAAQQYAAAMSRQPSRAPSIAGGMQDAGGYAGDYNRTRSRAPSVAPSMRSGYGRSAADPANIPLPQSMAPSMGAFSPQQMDPASIPLPRSMAPSVAPLSPRPGAGQGWYQTPAAAANFPLPPSDNRTAYGSIDRGEQFTRPASRAPTVAGSPMVPAGGAMLGATLSPPNRPVSRAGSRGGVPPGTTGTYYPPLPPEGGTVLGAVPWRPLAAGH